MSPGKMARAGGKLLDGLYPRGCCACGNPVAAPGETGLCWDCRAESTPLGPPWCERCGMAVAGRIDHAFLCADCREEPPAFVRARSLFRYEGGVREAIHALKYRGDFSVVPDLARLLLAGIRSHFADPETLVLVPVPLHRRRRFHRQFNQAEELLRGMRRQAPELRVWKGLRRVKDTGTQTRLSKARRARNVRGAFAVRGRAPVPERVILVDDVMTTGATLHACAMAIRKASRGTEIHAITLARG